MTTIEAGVDDMTPWKDWFKGPSSRDRRRSPRQQSPALVAHYWNGGAPAAHPIRDISSTGLYLSTRERWYPGTLLMMTLQRTDYPESSGPSIVVQTRVVRDDANGVGFVFMTARNAYSRRPMEISNGADQKQLNHFLSLVRGDLGQALVEYALMVPLLFVLIVNMVNFGGFFYAWINIANAVRAGADYAVLGDSSVGYPREAGSANLLTVINEDMARLPNYANATISICKNVNGTVTAISGSCSGMPSDPEPTNYVLKTVDVTYTYSPFIPAGFQFARLSIYATIPPTTIHRRAVMRSLN